MEDFHREASTTARVKNGELIAMRRVARNPPHRSDAEVPVLGDLPIVGKLFGTTRIETRNTDSVIVVTPCLVMAPDAR
nr:hypothetical protein [Deinobacterium chartae]